MANKVEGNTNSLHNIIMNFDFIYGSISEVLNNSSLKLVTNKRKDSFAFCEKYSEISSIHLSNEVTGKAFENFEVLEPLVFDSNESKIKAFESYEEYCKIKSLKICG